MNRSIPSGKNHGRESVVTLSAVPASGFRPRAGGELKARPVTSLEESCIELLNQIGKV